MSSVQPIADQLRQQVGQLYGVYFTQEIGVSGSPRTFDVVEILDLPTTASELLQTLKVIEQESSFNLMPMGLGGVPQQGHMRLWQALYLVPSST